MSLANRFVFVAAAAVAATMGDLLMLYVVATANNDTVIVYPPGAALAIGAMLGALGIPVYWFGYWLIAQRVAVSHFVEARLIVLCGALIGSIGAVIHAVTAFAIRFDMTAGNRPLPPSQWMASWGTPLLVCWVIVLAAAVVAAIVIARIALSSGSPIPRVLGVLNPVVISVALIAVGLESAVGRAFLVPAAPNIAHVLFFFLAAATASYFGEDAGR